MEAHAAGAVGKALANLAEAMVQVALLQDTPSVYRPAGSAEGVRTTHATLDNLFDAARHRLRHAAHQLHRSADHLGRPVAPAPSSSAEPRVAPPATGVHNYASV
ncbi:hypothetical protein ABTZ98_02335 [Streptomyces bacillaris]